MLGAVRRHLGTPELSATLRRQLPVVGSRVRVELRRSDGSVSGNPGWHRPNGLGRCLRSGAEVARRQRPRERNSATTGEHAMLVQSLATKTTFRPAMTAKSAAV